MDARMRGRRAAGRRLSNAEIACALVITAYELGFVQPGDSGAS